MLYSVYMYYGSTTNFIAIIIIIVQVINTLKTQEVLRTAVRHRGNNFNIQSKYEQYILGILEPSSKQTKITNFFINNKNVHYTIHYIYIHNL